LADVLKNLVTLLRLIMIILSMIQIMVQATKQICNYNFFISLSLLSWSYGNGVWWNDIFNFFLPSLTRKMFYGCLINISLRMHSMNILYVLEANHHLFHCLWFSFIVMFQYNFWFSTSMIRLVICFLIVVKNMYSTTKIRVVIWYHNNSYRNLNQAKAFVLNINMELDKHILYICRIWMC